MVIATCNPFSAGAEAVSGQFRLLFLLFQREKKAARTNQSEEEKEQTVYLCVCVVSISLLLILISILCARERLQEA